MTSNASNTNNSKIIYNTQVRTDVSAQDVSAQDSRNGCFGTLRPNFNDCRNGCFGTSTIAEMIAAHLH